MEETRVRLLSLEEVRASMKRLQERGEQLVGQLRHDARQLVERSGRPVVDRILSLVDVGKLRADIHDRAERAVKELDARRTRLMASLHVQLERLSDPVVKELRAAAREVAYLKDRIAHVERRLEALTRETASKHRAA